MSKIIAITKPGIDIFETTSIDDFIFHSSFDTLKYEVQGVFNLEVDYSEFYDSDPPSGPFPAFYYHRTVGELSHNLGYEPYFAGYLIDVPVGGACQAPFAFGDAGFVGMASVFADDTKLYFRVFQRNIVNSGTDIFTFGYRIFKNDLGL